MKRLLTVCAALAALAGCTTTSPDVISRHGITGFNLSASPDLGVDSLQL